jgi:hypothetical protein
VRVGWPDGMGNRLGLGLGIGCRLTCFSYNAGCLVEWLRYLKARITWNHIFDSTFFERRMHHKEYSLP